MKRRGFTLIELIVVMAIIGILVVLAVPNFLEHTKDARYTRLMVESKEIEKAAEKYYMVNSDWPRLSDEPYSAEEVSAFAEKILDNRGSVIELDSDGSYYDIDYTKLNNYLKKPEETENYILQNPVGSVYALDGITVEAKGRVDNPPKNEEFSVTFTNAGSEGSFGPTQVQLESAYIDSGLAGLVVSNGGIQEWIVPKTGMYRVETFGASGYGNGLGAIMKGDVNLDKGTKLHILVGHKGIKYMNNSGTGGGGTYVVKEDSKSPYLLKGLIPVTPLVISGGGGDRINATTQNRGIDGAGIYAGAGGVNGLGGINGDDLRWPHRPRQIVGSPGGAGFLTDGQHPEGGTKSFLNGGTPIDKYSVFGGGSMGWNYWASRPSVEGTPGGAGGGYSGGGGAAQNNSGGGGGSYNSGLNQDNRVGNTGHGKVVITYIGK